MIREKEELLMCTFFSRVFAWWIDGARLISKKSRMFILIYLQSWWFGYSDEMDIKSESWWIQRFVCKPLLMCLHLFNIQHNIGLLYKRRKSRCHRGQLQKIICTAYVAVWWPIPNTNNKLLFRQREIKYPFLVFLNYDFYRRHEIM